MKAIPTATFLAIAKRHRVPQIGLNVVYRIDSADRVRTFDYALMLPIQWPGAPPVGPRPAALEEVIGMDPSCWFEDGYRLPVDPSDPDAHAMCLRFSRSEEPKGHALDRVRGFFSLLERLEAGGFQRVITGSGLQPILLWAQISLRAAEDPVFKQQADAALG